MNVSLIPAIWKLRPRLAVPGLLTLAVLAAESPLHAAEPVCAEAKAWSTAAETRCVIDALRQLDLRLERALAAVAETAAKEPGQTFLQLWRENLTGFYRTSADPRRQTEAFRRDRRAVCAYAKSVGFRGTGYGINTTRCELALTDALLDQLVQPEEAQR